MSSRALIEHILEQKSFAVCGVSRDHEKYGYKVYRSLRMAGYTVYGVNPNADAIDNDPCYPSLDNIPGQIDCIVMVTQPLVTEDILQVAGRLMVPFIWMQPGSESNAAYNLASSKGMQIISGGPCIMVAIKARRAKV
ncbi:MAG: CoA-binding protein [Chthonomonadaceae bacterium]|nr:CoA-binding protein [Chthonomonadaceae bacterium]